MTHTYNITGMTCNGCVSKAKSQLLKLGDVLQAEIQLSSPQATITMQNHIALSRLQSALSLGGNYTITEADAGKKHSSEFPVNATEMEGNVSWFKTYKPILIIAAYITGVSLLAEVNSVFDGERWMRHFMAGFFLVFSFFKLLNIKGFAESYAMYDIIAKRWAGWGYVYAFIELALGIAYLVQFNPLLTNIITVIVMGISIVGVMQSVLNKRKIQCACLGAVFNLPMSTITIMEDALMIVMSAIMIFSLV